VVIRFKPCYRIFLALAAVTAILVPLAASAAAEGGSCQNGTPVAGATLKVDGTVQDPSSGSYIVTVCRWPAGQTQVYSYSVAKRIDPNGTDLGQAAVGKSFAVGFSMAAGDQPVSAEVYGDVSDYAVSGQAVTITAKTVTMTQVNGPPNAGTSCALPETAVGVCATSVAKLSGGIRYTAASGTPRPGDALVGMFVGASANGYQVSLQGCPGISYSNPGAAAAQVDGGDTKPGSGPQQASSPVLAVEMNGPHFQQDGTTLNTGSLEAFMPNALLATCVGGDAEAAKAGLTVTRTEDGSTTPVTGSAFTATAEADGLRISVPRVGFSAPTYRMAFKASSKPSKPSVKWSSNKGSKSVTAAVTSVTGLSYTVSAKSGKLTKKGSCKANKKTKKTDCAIKLAKGSWAVSVTPKKSGVSGTASSKTFRF